MVIELVLLAAICAIQFVLKIPYFKMPLDRDYGAHGYLAYSWLKRKQIIYRDHYESKTPGIKLIYMLIIKWLGISRKSFRLFFALYNTLTTFAVYALGANLFSPVTGLLAAFLYALYSSLPSLWWHFSNTECYYVLPATLSFLCLAYSNSSNQSVSLCCIALAGLFGGITFMFKQPSLIGTAAPGLWFLALYGLHSIITDVGLYIFGYAIPIIAFFVYFILIKKTPWEKLPFSKKSLSMLKNYLTLPQSKSSQAAVEASRRRFRTIFYDNIMIIAFAAGGGLTLIFSTPSSGLMLVGWIAMAFLAAIISRTYLPYHFIPPVPPMCILASMVLVNAGNQVFTNNIFSAPSDSLVIFGASFVLLCLMIYELIKDLLMSPEFFNQAYNLEDSVYVLSEAAGKYIKSVTTEEDYVYSWGHQPDIYLWSERKAAVYCIYPPIINPPAFSKAHIEDEFIQLVKNKPAYFVITAEFGQFKMFEQFLMANYLIDKKFEPYLYVFKLKQA